MQCIFNKNTNGVGDLKQETVNWPENWLHQNAAKSGCIITTDN